jgi:hypothetical protein
MQSALERLQEMRAGRQREADDRPPLEPPLLAKYPPDELGEPCAVCGFKEKWVWLDGRQLCRPCLIWGHGPSVAIDDGEECTHENTSNGKPSATRRASEARASDDLRSWWQDAEGHCKVCRGRKAWRSIHGTVICGLCHPPASPALVAAWLEEHG